MSNHYYDATGVLVLNRVTPVITALFGDFNLDETYPGEDEVYIARMSESLDPQWDDIRDNLVELAYQLGRPFPADEEPSIQSYLGLLAKQFSAEDDPHLRHLLKAHRFEDGAELDVLFFIASCLDDGHGLQALRIEGCWHSDKPRLFEFGGNGMFISRDITINSSSSYALELGHDLHKAIQAGDVDDAAARIALETVCLLAGIGDDATRDSIRQRVGERLLGISPSRRPS